jgi:hypothetical protein
MIFTVTVTVAGFSVGCAFILVQIVKCLWFIDRVSHLENPHHGWHFPIQLATVGTISAFSVYGSSPTNKGIIVIALALILYSLSLAGHL